MPYRPGIVQAQHPLDLDARSHSFFFFQAEDGIRDYKVTGVQTCVLFQAEDGIRDYKVTGVQTCALPISEAAGERQTLLFIDGYLCDAPDLIFHGIFDRENLVFLVFDLHQDRKSTRLNSSHLVISYAVFCLKKKKKKKIYNPF